MRRLLPVLVLLFAASGCAALIYEVVWFQLLQLVIGSSAVSLGVLLGTYMGGMCLGSLLLYKVVSRDAHPLRVYAWIELGIGLCGLLVLFGAPRLNDIYPSIANAVGASGFGGVLLRGAIAALCLLPPTILMGASLPAMARWIEADPKGVAWLGFFYGGNIAGAVVGAVIAGFYLLRLYDMAMGTYAAVAINIVVGVAGLILAAWVKRDQQQAEAGEPESAEAAPELPITAEEAANPAWTVYVAIALSGLCALGAEVVWTRQLSLMLGATVYAFSIILAVFLAGLGIGSAAGAVIARRGNARIALGVCQCLLAAATAWAAYTIAILIPSPDFDPTLLAGPTAIFKLDLARCTWAILPAAILWGASFPLALGALASRRRSNASEDTGALVGATYAANTVGGIVGALAFSMVVIPAFGTTAAERWLILLPALAAVVVLAPLVRRSAIAAATVLVALTAGAVGAWTVRDVPWLALAYGRRMNEYKDYNSRLLYMGEGRNSSIAVSEYPNGVRYFHVSGKVEATTEQFDMRLQRMLGHLSALLVKKPESVLVVGFGAGVTAGTFVLHPDVQHITISEIEPLVPAASSQYFKTQNYDVFHDPRTRVFYDDARHFVLTSNEKFDVITSDPIHPWVKGTSTLYSKEYFELCKRHLKPGGVVTQWVPLYESDPETIKSELATFFAVFPHGTVWNSDAKNEGYDVVVVGRAEPESIDLDALDARMKRPDHAKVTESLAEVGLGSAMDLMLTYAGRDDELRPWLQGAQINRDVNMRLQYLAGWGLNYNHADVIFSQIRSYRTVPGDLFVGKPASLDLFRRGLLGQLP
jgi:spermidine synthase